MRPMTRQDHIDPKVIKVQKCDTPGCRPNGIMVLFQVVGYTKNEFPVWVCSSGHCSDYDEIPNLRKPEDDPWAWLQENVRQLMNYVEPMKCDAHAPMRGIDVPPDLEWGWDGHLWQLDGDLKLCQPQTADAPRPKKEHHLLVEKTYNDLHTRATWVCSCGETGAINFVRGETKEQLVEQLFEQHQNHRQEAADSE